MTSSRFMTLLRREWMQHHRGYLVLMGVPPLLLLAVLLLAPNVHMQPSDPTLMMAAAMAAVTGVVLTVSWIAVAFQAPGLARRDTQDRSIEFWLSLPVGHASSIGATLLMHGLLIPLLALAVGFLSSQLIGALAVGMTHGAGALASLPWPQLLVIGFAGLLRAAFGVVLASLWVSPLVLCLMLASAALKRWGVPAVMATLGIGGLVLDKVYGITIVGDTIGGLMHQAGKSLLGASRDEPMEIDGDNIEQMHNVLGMFPQWAAHDALAALTNLAQPLFVFAIAVAGLCFLGLVQVRRRAA
jgi:ABC-2 type transport system permease protein